MKAQNSNELCTCYECRGSALGRRENYAYSECGLQNVVLKDVLVYRCARCGSSHVEIPNMDGLHRTLALAVLCKATLLSSEEIRFLRRVAGFATATEFATSLGVTKNAVSKWENNGKLGPKSDRAIRVTCGLAIIDEIVNDRSGAVDAQDVRLTLTKLQQFLVKFRSMGVLSAIRDEVRESERLIVDPELPFSFSILQPASAERPQLVQ